MGCLNQGMIMFKLLNFKDLKLDFESMVFIIQSIIDYLWHVLRLDSLEIKVSISILYYSQYQILN